MRKIRTLNESFNVFQEQWGNNSLPHYSRCNQRKRKDALKQGSLFRSIQLPDNLYGHVIGLAK